MADTNLQKDTQVSQKSEMTLDKALHYIQNGTGQQSKSDSPLAVVKVPRKNPTAIQSGIYASLLNPMTDKERADAKDIIAKATPELFDKVFFDDITQVGLANNVQAIVNMLNVIQAMK